MTASKAIKLDAETYNRLKALGETSQRSPHWLMKEAIKQFIIREEEAQKLRQETLKRIKNYEATGETVPYEVIDAWLATWGTENEGQCPASTI
jgi:predicted transcriptional regulator